MGGKEDYKDQEDAWSMGESGEEHAGTCRNMGGQRKGRDGTCGKNI